MAYAGQTLEKPASGERITFRQTAAQTDGELVAIDLELPADRRVPGGQHIHPNQEERFEVVEGTMRFKLGRKRVIAGPGEVVVVAAGQKHDFANVGDDDALVRVEVRPALKMEQLFETAVGLADRAARCWAASRGPSTWPCSPRSSMTRCGERSHPAGCSASPSPRWPGSRGAAVARARHRGRWTPEHESPRAAGVPAASTGVRLAG
jgi:mannose-6-phosphate isomerase-like protein (cupin superfamily)